AGSAGQTASLTRSRWGRAEGGDEFHDPVGRVPVAVEVGAGGAAGVVVAFGDDDGEAAPAEVHAKLVRDRQAAVDDHVHGRVIDADDLVHGVAVAVEVTAGPFLGQVDEPPAVRRCEADNVHAGVADGAVGSGHEQHGAGRVAVVVEIGVTLVRFDGPKGDPTAADHGEPAGGRCDPDVAGSPGRRPQLHDPVAGVAVAVEVPATLVGFPDHDGEAVAGEAGHVVAGEMDRQTQVLHSRPGSPQMDDPVGAVTVAVEVPATLIGLRDHEGEAAVGEGVVGRERLARPGQAEVGNPRPGRPDLDHLVVLVTVAVAVAVLVGLESEEGDPATVEGREDGARCHPEVDQAAGQGPDAGMPAGVEGDAPAVEGMDVVGSGCRLMRPFPGSHTNSTKPVASPSPSKSWLPDHASDTWMATSPPASGTMRPDT